MAFYENQAGDSPILAYEIGDDSITIKYNNGSVYQFTYHSAGSANVEQMKKYALFGHGLNGFITRFVGMSAGTRVV